MGAAFINVTSIAVVKQPVDKNLSNSIRAAG